MQFPNIHASSSTGTCTGTSRRNSAAERRRTAAHGCMQTGKRSRVLQAFRSAAACMLCLSLTAGLLLPSPAAAAASAKAQLPDDLESCFGLTAAAAVMGLSDRELAEGVTATVGIEGTVLLGTDETEEPPAPETPEEQGWVEQPPEGTSSAAPSSSAEAGQTQYPGQTGGGEQTPADPGQGGTSSPSAVPAPEQSGQGNQSGQTGSQGGQQSQNAQQNPPAPPDSLNEQGNDPASAGSTSGEGGRQESQQGTPGASDQPEVPAAGTGSGAQGAGQTQSSGQSTGQLSSGSTGAGNGTGTGTGTGTGAGTGSSSSETAAQQTDSASQQSRTEQGNLLGTGTGGSPYSQSQNSSDQRPAAPQMAQSALEQGTGRSARSAQHTSAESTGASAAGTGTAGSGPASGADTGTGAGTGTGGAAQTPAGSGGQSDPGTASESGSATASAGSRSGTSGSAVRLTSCAGSTAGAALASPPAYADTEPAASASAQRSSASARTAAGTSPAAPASLVNAVPVPVVSESAAAAGPGQSGKDAPENTAETPAALTASAEVPISASVHADAPYADRSAAASAQPHRQQAKHSAETDTSAYAASTEDSTGPETQHSSTENAAAVPAATAVAAPAAGSTASAASTASAVYGGVRRIMLSGRDTVHRGLSAAAVQASSQVPVQGSAAEPAAASASAYASAHVPAAMPAVLTAARSVPSGVFSGAALHSVQLQSSVTADPASWNPGAAGGAQNPLQPDCTHAHLVTVQAGVSPTCTEPGMSTGVMCRDCGLVLAEPAVIPPFGHQYENGVCRLCGALEPGASSSSPASGSEKNPVSGSDSQSQGSGQGQTGSGGHSTDPSQSERPAAGGNTGTGEHPSGNGSGSAGTSGGSQPSQGGQSGTGTGTGTGGSGSGSGQSTSGQHETPGTGKTDSGTGAGTGTGGSGSSTAGGSSGTGSGKGTGTGAGTGTGTGKTETSGSSHGTGISSAPGSSAAVPAPGSTSGSSSGNGSGTGTGGNSQSGSHGQQPSQQQPSGQSPAGQSPQGDSQSQTGGGQGQPPQSTSPAGTAPSEQEPEPQEPPLSYTLRIGLDRLTVKLSDGTVRVLKAGEYEIQAVRIMGLDSSTSVSLYASGNMNTGYSGFRLCASGLHVEGEEGAAASVPYDTVSAFIQASGITHPSSVRIAMDIYLRPSPDALPSLHTGNRYSPAGSDRDRNTDPSAPGVDLTYVRSLYTITALPFMQVFLEDSSRSGSGSSGSDGTSSGSGQAGAAAGSTGSAQAGGSADGASSSSVDELEELTGRFADGTVEGETVAPVLAEDKALHGSSVYRCMSVWSVLHEGASCDELVLSVTDSATGAPVADSEFDLFRLSETGSAEDYELVLSSVVSNENGEIHVRGAPFGTYRFVQVRAASGYALPAGTAAWTETGVYSETVSVSTAAVRKPGSVTLVSRDAEGHTDSDVPFILFGKVESGSSSAGAGTGTDGQSQQTGSSQFQQLGVYRTGGSGEAAIGGLAWGEYYLIRAYTKDEIQTEKALREKEDGKGSSESASKTGGTERRRSSDYWSCQPLYFRIDRNCAGGTLVATSVAGS